MIGSNFRDFYSLCKIKKLFLSLITCKILNEKILYYNVLKMSQQGYSIKKYTIKKESSIYGNIDHIDLTLKRSFKVKSIFS